MVQHVGRVSDSINNEVEGGARARLQQVMKPTGKVYKGGVSSVGNGDRCVIEGHGNKIVLSGGSQWCPNQSHDNERITH